MQTFDLVTRSLSKVVGPSMCGKSYFVKQMLEYDNPRRQRHTLVLWTIPRHVSRYEKKFGERHCLSEFKPDLSNIYPCSNNIVVLDDLMDMAVDSPIISKLFTQWRQSNARVILLLQNAFSKGKYNTSISHNAQYMTLFRCPADRRQIGIVADRIFDKNKPAFMEIYKIITSK